MQIECFSLPTRIVRVDDNHPDPDSSYVVEHLVHHYEMGDPLPTITLLIKNGVATVVRGHKYLEVALRLGRPRIDAVSIDSKQHEVEAFLKRADVQSIDWKQRLGEANSEPVVGMWHTLFFNESLSDEDRLELERRLSHFAGGTISVQVDDSGQLARVRLKSRPEDRNWATSLLACLLEFSRERVRLVSQNGLLFPFS